MTNRYDRDTAARFYLKDHGLTGKVREWIEGGYPSSTEWVDDDIQDLAALLERFRRECERKVGVQAQNALGSTDPEACRNFVRGLALAGG